MNQQNSAALQKIYGLQSKNTLKLRQGASHFEKEGVILFSVRAIAGHQLTQIANHTIA